MTADDFHGTSAPAVIDRRYSKVLRDSAPQPARLPLQLNSCAETVPSPIPRAGRRSKGLRGCKRRVWTDGRHEQLPGDNRARSIGWQEIRRWRSRECCEDRKSTRLNSSHVEISYAVFCLKKKKKKNKTY